MCTIVKISKATPVQSKSESLKLYRVIGSVDIDGKGTSHDIAAVDPFIFLDEAIIEGEMSSSFHKHPHAGLAAVTYLLEGTSHAWDNINGATPDLNRAGGVYFINSGSGVVHGEAPTEGVRKVHLLQLWLLPDIFKDTLPKPTYQLFQPHEVPVYQDSDLWVKVIIGEGFGVTSPVVSSWPVQYLHVKLGKNQSKEFTVPDKTWNGFIYVINGEGKFGTNAIHATSRHCLILEANNDNSILVQNMSSGRLEFILATGKPHNKPFVKLLGHGGAVIADSETRARRTMLDIGL